MLVGAMLVVSFAPIIAGAVAPNRPMLCVQSTPAGDGLVSVPLVDLTLALRARLGPQGILVGWCRERPAGATWRLTVNPVQPSDLLLEIEGIDIHLVERVHAADTEVDETVQILATKTAEALRPVVHRLMSRLGGPTGLLPDETDATVARLESIAAEGELDQGGPQGGLDQRIDRWALSLAVGALYAAGPNRVEGTVGVSLLHRWGPVGAEILLAGSGPQAGHSAAVRLRGATLRAGPGVGWWRHDSALRVYALSRADFIEVRSGTPDIVAGWRRYYTGGAGVRGGIDVASLGPVTIELALAAALWWRRHRIVLHDRVALAEPWAEVELLAATRWAAP